MFYQRLHQCLQINDWFELITYKSVPQLVATILQSDLPSLPPMYSPKHHTLPSCCRPQLWYLPACTKVQFAERTPRGAASCIGVRLSNKLKLVKALLPQLHIPDGGCDVRPYSGNPYASGSCSPRLTSIQCRLSAHHSCASIQH